MRKDEYQAYLSSREWALRREAVRVRSGNKCERCWMAKMNAVHHVTYHRIGGERLEDLMAICDPCHEFLSGKSDTDPRVAFDVPPLVIGTSSWEPTVSCPFCSGDNLHHTRIQVFERKGGEDGDTFGVTVSNGVSSACVTSRNPSSRRNGVLIHFFCETCCVGHPPGPAPKFTDDEYPDEYELPVALAIHQHKGTTYLCWMKSTIDGTGEKVS